MTKHWELALGVCSSCGILFQMLLFPQLDQNRAFITTFQAILAFAMQLSQWNQLSRRRCCQSAGSGNHRSLISPFSASPSWWMRHTRNINGTCLIVVGLVVCWEVREKKPLLGWFSCRTFSHQPRDVLKIFMDPVLILVEMFIPRSLSLRFVWFCLDDSIFLHIFYIISVYSLLWYTWCEAQAGLASRVCRQANLDLSRHAKKQLHLSGMSHGFKVLLPLRNAFAFRNSCTACCRKWTVEYLDMEILPTSQWDVGTTAFSSLPSFTHYLQ